MRHFRVRNWDKFQHYKDRNPPWIKLHTELLDNYEFSRLHDASKLLALCITLLAARSDNEIPANIEWIQKRANLKTKPDLQPLFDSKFIEWVQELPEAEQLASTELAERKQDACSLTEERRDRGEHASAFDPTCVKDLDQEAWRKWIDHRRAIKKPIRDHAMQDAAEALAKLGERQMEEVKRAVSGGWQGLHPDSKSKVNGERGKWM